MSGVNRVFLLPFVAASLLLLGCGVPISPDAITATAVADEENARRQQEGSIFTASDNSALTLPAAASSIESQGAQPAATVPTLPSSTATATSEDDAQLSGEEPAGDDESGGDDSTPDAGSDDEDTEALDEAANGDSAVASAGAPTAIPPAETPHPVVTNNNGEFITEFLALLNAQRTGRGLSALSLNPLLSEVATKFAGYMGTAGFFGHDGPDRSSPGSRVSSSGYTGAFNGEALAAGQWTPQTALNALLASAPHAAILLDPRSVEVGVGYAFVDGSRYRHYWVVVTGIP